MEWNGIKCNICICNRKKPALSLIAQSGPYQGRGIVRSEGFTVFLLVGDADGVQAMQVDAFV